MLSWVGRARAVSNFLKCSRPWHLERLGKLVTPCPEPEHRLLAQYTAMTVPKEFKADPRYKWLKEHLPGATSDLLRLHLVGQKIDSLVGEKQYGAGMMEKLAEGLGKSVSQLCGFRKLSQLWTQEEFKRVLAKAERKKTRLTWHHFRSLLTINPRQYDSPADAKAKRTELLSQCIDEGWNSRQLKAATQEELGREKEKRTLVKPEGFEQGLEEFIEHSEAYLRRFEEVWFGSGGVITADSCPKTLSRRASKLVRESGEVAQRLRGVVARATKIRDELPRSTRARN